MTSKLAAYWRKFEPSAGGLHVHPQDYDWLKSNSACLSQPVLGSFAAYVQSDRFGTQDRELHLSLLPVPFVGNLETADILIFIQNPGLAAVDYLLEEDKDFQTAALRTLRQEAIEDYPFWCLNPAFAWSEALAGGKESFGLSSARFKMK